MKTPLQHQLDNAYTHLLFAYISYLDTYLHLLEQTHATSAGMFVESLDSVAAISKHVRLLLPLSHLTEAFQTPSPRQMKNTHEKK